MWHDPEALIRAARAGVTAVLVSRRGWQRLLGAARGVPRDLSPLSMLLECRVDRRNALADVSFQVAATSPHLASQPGLAERLAMGWLEYDSGVDPDLPPSRFFTPAYTRQPARPADVCRTEAAGILRALAAASAPGPPGNRLDARTVADAERAIRALPATCKVRQIGLMESRTPVGLRLCLSGFDGHGISCGSLGDYLAVNGYAAVADDLTRSREGLLPVSDHLDLSLDVPPTAGVRAGWEIQLSRRNHAREPRWAALFEYLETWAHLWPGKREALTRVCGSRRAPVPEARSTNPEACFLVYHVNHLKLAFDRVRGRSIKAYLGVVPYVGQLRSRLP